MTDRILSRRALLKTSAAGAASLTAASLLPSGTLHSAMISAGLATVPADSRLGALKDLNGYFPFVPSSSVEEWNKRKEFVIRQIQVACGIWPMPERPAIEAVVHGRVERDGYTVDRVFFESSPGLFVTGSLYLPASPAGKLPTILCPHGHWANGRFHDHGPDELKRQLASGGEADEVGGRFPLQARCVQLARMGCMVFLYDMLGYADGGSLTQELAHGFAKQRPHLSSPDQFGLFSAQAELRCLNAMGLQTWNSIRALDWIMSRPDCDTERIGVTGASGGGTQTFILAAIDERVKAAFPAVMVSTAMQGGCTCENASYLRVNTGNIEFAALIAPRPVAMTGADDWTVEIESKGLPELQQHYKMLGAPDNIVAKYMKFPHNYNLPSRMMMYEFFNRTLNLGVNSIEERPYVPLTREEATVFNAKYPAPQKSEQSEVALLKSLDEASRKQIAALLPRDSAGMAEFRRVVGGALEVMIGRSLPPAGAAAFEKKSEQSHGSFTRYDGLLRLQKYAEELPTVYLLPESWNRQAVLWIDGAGKSGMFAADGTPRTEVADLLKAGFAVGSVDLYLTGDFTEDGKPVSQYPIVKNPREFVGYTLGYNHSLFAQRVHDVLTLTSATKYHPQMPEKVHLVGINGAGPIVAAACALASNAVSSAMIDTAGFRFASITEYRDVNLLPGAVKYGDVPALLALCAPTSLAVFGETESSLETATAAYGTSSGKLALLTGDSASSAAANWLLNR